MFTAAHRRIAEKVFDMEKRGEPGFVPDLVRALGYAAESSLTATLKVMERKGLVSVRGGGVRGRSRMVALTSRARRALGGGGLPVLGAIPAGPLAEAVREADDVREPGDLLPWRDGDFLLRVKGDSMTGDGILDRDLVLIRPDVALHSGEIAAVLVGEEHETTLKRVFARGAEVTLRASNPLYADRTLPAETVKIAGVFRGLIRHASGGL